MKKGYVFTLITVFLLTVLLPASAMAAEPEKTVIRVGWFLYPGSAEIHDGKYSGYTYDYLMEIARYADWEYEFVETDFAACTEMLKNGEVDIVGGLQRTEEREEIYDFPDFSYGQTYTVLYTDKDSPLQPYDFNNYEGIRIGVLKDANVIQHIEKYAGDNDFSYNLFEYSSIEEINTAIEKGIIDAAALSSYFATESTRILARFAPTSTYIVTTKGNTEVLRGLNRALEYISINRLYFDAELYQKYYVSKESLELTEEESAIVQASQKNPVLVGVVDNCAPISYWNQEKNTYEGIAIEIFNTICEKTGLNVKYVPVDMSRREKAKTPNENSPQLVLGVPLLEGVNDDRDWYLSEPLLEAPLAIAGTAESNHVWSEGKGKIAISKDFVMAHTYIETRMPDFEIVDYPTLEGCMKAVADGEVDATVYFQSCIIYFLQKPYFNELMIVPANVTGTSLCAACFTEKEQILLQIVDKGMRKIPDDELRNLTLNITMLNTYHMTIEDILYKYRIPIVIIGILVLAIIIVLFILYSVKKSNAKKLNDANQQIKEALITVERASAAKGDFMSHMSHEIRTPLNAVIGYNTIARNEMTDARTDEERRQSEMKVMDCLTKSDIASRHLLTIINDVLDMSAIESGKIKIVNDRFDFKGLISSLTAIFYSQAKSKGVEFGVQFDTQMEEWVIGDQMRVNQILTNLLSNAIKFTPDAGKVTLFLHTQTLEDSIQLHMEVQDTGIGMSKEYMERIWTPFEQADSSISRRFGGTGLGLSITKTLVDLLGGTISVKSTQGTGTTFFVDLTFDRTDQPEEYGPYDFSSLNVLIVDDDISTCDYIRLLLTRSGVRSSAVYSGEEAINAVKGELKGDFPYTVCLIDWRMPKMDGLETVKQIRNIAGKDLPIIVITAYDFSEVADKAAEVGINMFISKPLFQSSLFNLLANISGSPVPRNDEKLNTYDFSGARILLVEDNTMNMEIALKILRSAKLTVDCAWNGQQAIDMFLAAPSGTYSAILMDIQMPIVDGYEATRVIRSSKHPDAKSLPIIAMTANAFAENVAESRAAGMNDHISKPIILPTLYQILKKYISL